MNATMYAPATVYKTIAKPPTNAGLPPNMRDYDDTCKSFDWDDTRAALDWLPGGGLNIAYEAVTRHARGARRDHLALRWLGKRGETLDISYDGLERLTNRFANVLRELGVEPGARVFTLAGRIPELYATALGTLKCGAVFCPLFSAFGPEPVRQRLSRGEGSVLVTTEALYRQKVAPIREALPDLQHVVIVGRGGEPTSLSGTVDFHTLLNDAVDTGEPFPTSAEDIALLHFTSGTTGMPKGAVHVHGAALMHHMTGKYALDLHPNDVFWCTADPGWVTGTSYGIIAPLLHGVTSVIDEAEFDVERWYRVLQDQRVSVWYSAPTAIRMLMKAGTELPRAFDLSALRFVASVGEPLNPEAVVWGQQALGLPIHDNWWQTETGGIMIANFPSLPIRPGSMGKPLPGVTAAIVERRPDGTIGEIATPETSGELALRPGWPSMFRGYLHEPERYAKCFVDGWYLTGDLARRDAGGYFWFVGRADDLIKSSGHLIGPFEVESTLMEHPAVAEAAVIGKPDPVAGEIVKAFVSLKTGIEPDDNLRLDLLGFARKRLGAVVAPKEIDILESLPKTRSGKLMRRLLKARELGLPTGDISTLEESS